MGWHGVFKIFLLSISWHSVAWAWLLSAKIWYEDGSSDKVHQQHSRRQFQSRLARSPPLRSFTTTIIIRWQYGSLFVMLSSVLGTPSQSASVGLFLLKLASVYVSTTNSTTESSIHTKSTAINCSRMLSLFATTLGILMVCMCTVIIARYSIFSARDTYTPAVLHSVLLSGSNMGDTASAFETSQHQSVPTMATREDLLLCGAKLDDVLATMRKRQAGAKQRVWPLQIRWFFAWNVSIQQ